MNGLRPVGARDDAKMSQAHTAGHGVVNDLRSARQATFGVKTAVRRRSSREFARFGQGHSNM